MTGSELQVTDHWAEQWGNPVLQDLGRWLERHQVPRFESDIAVDGLWVFYSYFVLPGYGYRQVPMGIGAARGEPPSLCVRLPYTTSPEVVPAVSDRDWVTLHEAFQVRLVEPLRSRIRLDLDKLRPKPAERFDTYVRRWCKSYAIECIGTYHDDLIAELATIVPPDVLDAWLQAPTAELGGVKPAMLLDPKHDRPLRDMLSAVRHGQPAWT